MEIDWKARATALEAERDGWKANCQVQLEETHRNMAARRSAEAQLARAREALERIASHDCGCWPCTGQCRKGEAAEEELEARIKIAREALRSPAPADGRGDNQMLASASCPQEPALSPAAMTERLIDAAVYAEAASGVYVGPARKEVSEARAAIETVITAAISAFESTPAAPSEGWQDISTAPRNASEILLRVPKSGWPGFRRVVGHWACDLSGEEQPGFKGWFWDHGNGFALVSPDPTHWMPFAQSTAQTGAKLMAEAAAALETLQAKLVEKDAEIERLRDDRDNSNRLLDECRHERNVLQRICAQRADALDAATAHQKRVHKLRDASLDQAHRANEDAIAWRNRALAAEATAAQRASKEGANK